MFNIIKASKRIARALKRLSTRRASQKDASDATSTRGIYNSDYGCTPVTPSSPRISDISLAPDTTATRTTLGHSDDWTSISTNAAVEDHLPANGDTPQELRQRRRDAPIYPRYPVPRARRRSTCDVGLVLWYPTLLPKGHARRLSSITTSLDAKILHANRNDPMEYLDGTSLQLALAGEPEASTPFTGSEVSPDVMHSVNDFSSPSSRPASPVPRTPSLRPSPPRSSSPCPNLHLPTPLRISESSCLSLVRPTATRSLSLTLGLLLDAELGPQRPRTSSNPSSPPPCDLGFKLRTWDTDASFDRPRCASPSPTLASVLCPSSSLASRVESTGGTVSHGPAIMPPSAARDGSPQEEQFPDKLYSAPTPTASMSEVDSPLPSSDDPTQTENSVAVCEEPTLFYASSVYGAIAALNSSGGIARGPYLVPSNDTLHTNARTLEQLREQYGVSDVQAAQSILRTANPQGGNERTTPDIAVRTSGVDKAVNLRVEDADERSKPSESSPETYIPSRSTLREPSEIV